MPINAVFDINGFLKEQKPVGTIIEGVKNAAEKMKGYYINKKKFGLISNLFGIEGKVSMRPGKVHPMFTDVHPDDRETYIFLSKLVNNKNLKAHSTWVKVDAYDSVISLGGPMSNFIARKNMGYQLKGNELLKMSDFPIELPFAFNIPKTSEISKRYMEGNVYKTPNGGVITPLGKFRIKAKKGWLAEDYLVITRIPNLLNEVVWNERRDALLIIGIHGIGTKAIELACNDIEILKSISEDVNDNRYYQSLLWVKEIYHDEENLDSVPLDIHHIKSEPLVINDDKINLWFKERSR